MTAKETLAEIAKWCDLWLKGETDRRYTQELISGIKKMASAANEKPYS